MAFGTGRWSRYGGDGEGGSCKDRGDAYIRMRLSMLRFLTSCGGQGSGNAGKGTGRGVDAVAGMESTTGGWDKTELW